MKRKQPPPIEVDTLDQEMLVWIHAEMANQTRLLRSINTTVGVIGAIIVLTIILSCVAVILGGPSLLF